VATGKGMEKGLKKGMKKGREEGITVGMEKGMEKGAYDRAKIIALSMLKKGLPLDVIVECTGLSEEEILKLEK
ncbi:MAG: transposase, partial [Rickettsiales bacterium]|jgi:predicted transposase YdaD|nr:transposase [Rickettsiales bacterium]